MTIKRQLYASAWASCVVVFVILVTLFLSTRQIDLEVQKSSFAGDITANGIAGLRSVTVDYLLNPQQRSLTQWQQRQASLRTLLATQLYQGSDEQVVIVRLLRRNDYLGEIFPKFVTLHNAHHDQTEKGAPWRQVEARLVTQMMMTTQEMVADATELIHRSHDRLQKVQRRSNLIVTLMVVLLGLTVMLDVALAIRNILIPLRKLRQVAALVGEGNLECRAAMTQANEIGSLSRTFDDMTVRLGKAQAAVQVKTRRLEEMVKELEAFSYSVAHDLRSPLSGIDGWSLVLQEDYGSVLDKTGQGYLATVRSEAQRMGALIDDLLQLSRVTRRDLRREPVDLSALAQRVAGRLKDANPTRAIEFLIEPDLLADADVHLMEVVITNLLDNACKYTGTRPLARIEVGSTKANDSQREVFFVRDNGVGFDMTHSAKLFTAFQRLHAASEFPGSGVGLATVQRIVQRHGGKIWATAQVGQGAVFYFTLEEAS